MGAWDVGLCDNDDAADLKERMGFFARLPLDGKGLFQRLASAFPDLTDESAEAHGDLLLAAADQFHLYGIACPPLATAAEALLRSGQDLKLKAALGLSPADLKRRAKHLEKLALKLAVPHPRPKTRRIVTSPQSPFAPAGACFAYPIGAAGEPINPYFPAAYTDEHFKRAGFGAFAVLWSGPCDEVFSAALVVRLALKAAQPPILEECAAAEIDWTRAAQGAQGRLAAVLGIFSAKELPKLRVEPIGRLSISAAAVAVRFPAIAALPPLYEASLADHLGHAREAFVLEGEPIHPVPVSQFLA